MGMPCRYFQQNWNLHDCTCEKYRLLTLYNQIGSGDSNFLENGKKSTRANLSAICLRNAGDGSCRSVDLRHVFEIHLGYVPPAVFDFRRI